MQRTTRPGRLCLSWLLILALCLSLFPAGGETAAAAEPTAVYKTFIQMTREEKTRVLAKLIADRQIPTVVRVSGADYRLNEELWYSRGLIVYGMTANVNATVTAAGSSNYRNGQYRYWGFDVNGGLYANDHFPRDSDTGTPAYKKNWLTTTQIASNTTARRYVGEHAFGQIFSAADRQATAQAFLRENSAWVSAGLDGAYILGHFYFNAVLSPTGFTQGQFIGVHKSQYNGQLYYQTFSVEAPVKVYEIPPLSPPAPPGSEPADPPGGDPADPPGGDPTDPPGGEPAAPIEVDCQLSVPAVTYAGHPTTAVDQSMFTVDGQRWSASRTYDAGLANNAFTANGGGSVRREGIDRAAVTFPTPGAFLVELTVTPKNGGSGRDIKPIEVKKTPTIIATLAGTQKENRRQTLFLRIAKSPRSPLARLTVQLSHPETGEKADLAYRFDGQANQPAVGETIKTRAIEKMETTPYFETYKLDFLTRNREATDYRYEVTVVDQAGNRDEAARTFPVAVDQPPKVDLLMEAAYIRHTQSNVAVIDVEDGSLTDGDQIDRTWHYRAVGETEWQPISGLPGYRDRSFGTARRIEFGKTGVGAFEVRLRARDRWTEETLEEYVTEADRRSAEDTARSDVINVAPMVSLSAKPLKTARITILTGGKDEHREVAARLTEWKVELLKRGIHARFQLEPPFPDAAAQRGQRPVRRFTVQSPFGYEGNWTFYEKDNFLVDDHCLYKISATWPSSDMGGCPQPPYTIACWESSGSEPRWTFSFTEQLMPVPLREPYLAQDDGGRYLFFGNGSRTLMLDKSTGAFLTALEWDTGKQLYTGDHCVYALKPEGVYRIDTGDGKILRVAPATVVAGETARIAGNLHFVAVLNGALRRGVFRPESSRLTYEDLRGALPDPAQSILTCRGVDSRGRILLECLKAERSQSGAPLPGYRLTLLAIDRDNREKTLLSNEALSYKGEATVSAVRDEGGVCRYLTVARDERSSTTYGVKIRLIGIDANYRAEASATARNGYPTASRNIAFAREIGGKIYYAAGADWIYVANTGYHIYPERTYTCIFDPSLAGPRQGKLQGELGLPDDTAEYRAESPSITAVQTGDNGPNAPNGNRTHVLFWNQTIEDLVGRGIRRAVNTGATDNLVVLCDRRNWAAAEPDGWMNRLRAELARSNTGFLALAGENFDAQTVCGQIAETAEQPPRRLATEVADGRAGALKRAFQLEPNTDYVYEYLTDSPPEAENDQAGFRLTVAHRTDATGRAQFSDAKPEIPVRESYREEFGDATVERFYSLNEDAIGEGYYKGANLTIVGDTNRYVEEPWPDAGKTAIRFTVPEGRRGLLSMEYLMDKDYESGTSKWMSAGIRIDGEWWQASTPNPGKGVYTHPVLLMPGSHTLTFRAAAYGTKGKTAKMWLDTLTVDLLADGEAGAAGSPENPGAMTEEGAEAVTVEPMGSQLWKVRGRFRTPPAVASCRAVENATVVSGVAGQDGLSTWVAPTGIYAKALEINIPARKIAMDVQWETDSVARASGNNKYNVQYIMPLEQTGTTPAHLWQCNARIDQPVELLYHFPSGSRIAPGMLAGTRKLNIRAATTNGASGNILATRYVLIDDDCRFWGTLRHYLYDGRLMLETGRYRESELRLSVPAGLHQLSGFRLYAEENGERRYTAEEAFSDAAELERWQADDVRTAILPIGRPTEPEEKLVFRKGEPVAYNVRYTDYEADPSKKQYWRYTHQPFNDGPHPMAAAVLNETEEVVDLRPVVLDHPLDRFEIDGRYTVEHWQEDNTARPVVAEGNPDYDRTSNVESLTFYIEGTGSAPKIRSIQTEPGTVPEDAAYRLKALVDDAEKDELSLTLSVYQAGQLVFTERKTGIAADRNGQYPPVFTKWLDDLAQAGRYEVVGTVRDYSGVGLGQYRFEILSAGKATGRVLHTDEWERNRKRYNFKQFGEEYSLRSDPTVYPGMKPPRKRGVNVFWAGEKLLLEADVAGTPRTVKAEISAAGKTYRAILSGSGIRNAAGEELYRGELWDRDMVNRWGRAKPEAIVVRFIAEYGNGRQKTFDETILFDSRIDYWLLHRLW